MVRGVILDATVDRFQGTLQRLNNLDSLKNFSVLKSSVSSMRFQEFVEFEALIHVT